MSSSSAQQIQRSAATPQHSDPLALTSPDAVEKQGRRWLLWSFILCPCHLPVTLGILGAIAGGGAFSSMVSRGSMTVGVVLTSLYAVGLTIGLRHVREANKLRSCADGQCSI